MIHQIILPVSRALFSTGGVRQAFERFAKSPLIPTIPASAFVHPSSLVAGNVEIGNDASVWPHCVLRGDLNLIQIGERSNVQDGCVLHVRGDFPGRQKGRALIVGPDVSIGHKACLHACTIESGTLIGIGAIVLDEAVVQSGALIAAGSLVPPKKVCGPGLWAGTPVKRLRDLSDEEKDMLRWNVDNYVVLKDLWKQKLKPST